MKSRKTWILIADGARARIVEQDGPGAALKDALGFGYAASHAPTRDFGSDKAGRGMGRDGSSHHTKAAKIDWHTYEKHVFAIHLAEELDKAHGKGAFDDLVLVAPPKALGELRAALGPNVKQQVAAELGKDLTHVSLHDLSDHLGDVIRL